MSDLGKRRRLDRRSDLIVRAVGADQLRKGVFQLVIATDERVIVGVRNLGRILGMVAFAVMGDRFRQPHKFVGGVGLRSEERRVGNEGASTFRSRWSPDHYTTNKPPTIDPAYP